MSDYKDFVKYFSAFLEDHAFVSIKKKELTNLIDNFNSVKAENKSLKKTVLDLQEEVMDLQDGIIESDGE